MPLMLAPAGLLPLMLYVTLKEFAVVKVQVPLNAIASPGIVKAPLLIVTAWSGVQPLKVQTPKTVSLLVSLVVGAPATVTVEPC